MNNNFSNGIFYSVSDFYKKIFGVKIYKLSIDAGCTCPTRDGTKGYGGCIFCSSAGSGDFAASRALSVKNQLEQAKKLVQDKNKSGKYIAYFQNFTSTYGNECELEKKYFEAVSCEDISGIAIATRPDCLGDNILSILKKLSEKKFLQVELGFQTSRAESVKYIRRGYENEELITAIKKIHLLSPSIHVVTHLIFGFPGESREDMLASLKFCLKAGTDGVKISLLHVLKDSDLYSDYEKGLFKCLEMEEYFSILGDALKLIPQDIVVHRLTGDGNKKNLIAPLWTGNKKFVFNSMFEYFRKNNIEQGSDAYIKK